MSGAPMGKLGRPAARCKTIWLAYPQAQEAMTASRIKKSRGGRGQKVRKRSGRRSI